MLGVKIPPSTLHLLLSYPHSFDCLSFDKLCVSMYKYLCNALEPHYMQEIYSMKSIHSVKIHNVNNY